MKLYRYILLLGALAVTSCDLDEFPQDKLAPENYFNNEAELRTFTNTFYQQNLPTAESIYSETPTLSSALLFLKRLQEQGSSKMTEAAGLPAHGIR